MVGMVSDTLLHTKARLSDHTWVEYWHNYMIACQCAANRPYIGRTHNFRPPAHDSGTGAKTDEAGPEDRLEGKVTILLCNVKTL